MRPALLTGMLLALLGIAPMATANAAIAVLVGDPLTPCRPVPSGTPIVATIQDGIDNATPGDQVGVCPGTYAGGVLITKAGITLEGFGAPEINGPSGSHGIVVNADDVAVLGFDISGFGGCGVLVSGANRVSVVRNHVHGNGNGICLSDTEDSHVGHNTAEANTNSGIEASFSSHAQIANNTVTRNRREGIFGLEALNDSDIDHNLITDNVLRNIIVQRSTGTRVTNNTLRDGGGLVAVQTLHLVVDHNEVVRTDSGIVVSNSSYCTLSNNAVAFTNTSPVLAANANGIGLFTLDHCLITHNTSRRNRGNGILVSRPGDEVEVSYNAASGNVAPFPIVIVFDCLLVLDGGTMPTFIQNVCGTESPPGVWK